MAIGLFVAAAACDRGAGVERSDGSGRETAKGAERPNWAVEAGRDAYGAWAELEFEGHRTRFRRIPKGTFMMGSVADEGGRNEDEPQHEVTLSRDYWLAESECTQTLWRLVMDDNPSFFVSDERPVENVTWPDVQLFLTRLNELVPGLGARLPTEAEWEYGCRAQTSAETYAGELQVLGTYNAPVLDEIAWYGGNSGLEFELDNGLDSSSWPDKQYPHHVAGSRVVTRKQPNRWGLYDTLGNLWEWCQDWYGPYGGDAVVDPRGPATGESRVIRGGSWFDGAIEMRAANRNQATPEDKVIILGFRIALGSED